VGRRRRRRGQGPRDEVAPACTAWSLPDGTVLWAAFGADGRRPASAGTDSLIWAWDVASKDCRLTLRGHADEALAAVLHPDGSRIASGGATA